MLQVIKINELPELKTKNINKIHLNKDLVNVGVVKKSFNQKKLPLTMDLNYYGQKLEFDIDLKGNFTNIKYNGNNLLDNLVLNPESEIKGGSKILT